MCSKRTTKGVAAGAAAVIALATPFIAGWEGKRNYAYIPTPATGPPSATAAPRA
ncbi:hypothetical protein [Paracoccus beibuensis]|uniref:hypothetical protein n=1 Tax=Paracoccus beibuensis TaxID=547602 RepID=UPI002240B8BD|nr:hypothetical protein [Paracoccus beibuensis]